MGTQKNHLNETDGSFEYPKQLLKLMDKNIFTILLSKMCLSGSLIPKLTLNIAQAFKCPSSENREKVGIMKKVNKQCLLDTPPHRKIQ